MTRPLTPEEVRKQPEGTLILTTSYRSPAEILVMHQGKWLFANGDTATIDDPNLWGGYWSAPWISACLVSEPGRVEPIPDDSMNIRDRIVALLVAALIVAAAFQFGRYSVSIYPGAEFDWSSQ